MHIDFFKDILRKIKKIKFSEFIVMLKMLIIYPVALIMRINSKNRRIWLISERPDEACDNGYFFFKYIHENKLHDGAYYIIHKDSPDLKRLKSIRDDRIVFYKSFKHYLLYLMATVQISAHINLDKIDSRVCSFLEIYNIKKSKKVFLQHGITKDKFEPFFYKNTGIDLFISASPRERIFLIGEFGYAPKSVPLTGLCRYDNLKPENIKNQILIMPTWRSYLYGFDKSHRSAFRESDFYKRYMELLNHSGIHKLLERYDYKLVFYLHSGFRHFTDEFNVKSNRVIIASRDNFQIQELLKESKLLITDYSSVFFDMAYMEKPCIYYQFDYEEFRRSHLKEGYFSYKDDGFGPILKNVEELCKCLEENFSNNFTFQEEYRKRKDSFFEFKDNNNCKRVYESIIELENREKR